MTNTLERLPLKRMPKPYNDERPAYSHPNGWTIYQDERDWRLPRGAIGGGTSGNPKRWWAVRPRGQKRAYPEGIGESYHTLREARAWCDQHRFNVVTRKPEKIASFATPESENTDG